MASTAAVSGSHHWELGRRCSVRLWSHPEEAFTWAAAFQLRGRGAVGGWLGQSPGLRLKSQHTLKLALAYSSGWPLARSTFPFFLPWVSYKLYGTEVHLAQNSSICLWQSSQDFENALWLPCSGVGEVSNKTSHTHWKSLWKANGAAGCDMAIGLSNCCKEGKI